MTERPADADRPAGTARTVAAGPTADAGRRTRSADTLADVSHTDPHTDTSFGDTQVYVRGTVVAADGGRERAQGGGEAAGDRADEEGTGPRDGDRGDDARAGGAPDDPDGDRDRDDDRAPGEDRETLGEIDHGGPTETEGAQRTYERGTPTDRDEGREDPPETSDETTETKPPR